MALTEEQKLALEQGIPLRNGVPVETLSSASLSPTPDISSQITTPEVTPPSDVSDAYTPTPITTTPQEEKQIGISDRLQQINDLLAGKDAYQIEQEKKFGITDDLLKTQGDLDSQFKALANEQKAAELAFKYTIPNQQQLQATGRGITEGGLAPITAAELRKNQIYQGELASRALSIKSLQAAIDGKIATAKTLAERAVKKKFGALEAEQKAKQANLQLLIDDPRTSIQDKERAEKRKAIEDKRDEEIAKAKEVEKAKHDIANKVAATGKANAEQLNQIINAKDDIEANQLAAPFLQKVGGDDFTLGEGQIRYDANGNIIASNKLGKGGVVSGISPVTGKAYSEAQSKAATFGVRAKTAEETLSLGKQFRDVAPFQVLKSNERRQFEQAEKNFITALLRRESGASIADSEFASARLVYIPQFGDDATTLEQKAQARLVALQGLINESVGAYDELVSSLPHITQTPQASGTNGVTKSGIKYTVEQ